jgi:predicted transcriptional regulator
MSNTFTIDLPSEIAERAREVAARTNRPLEAVLVEWLGSASVDLPIESRSDAEVLAISESQLSEAQQAALSDLLRGQNAGDLTLQERVQLDELLDIYRVGMLRKSHALKVAVERGLRPRLGE